MHVEEHLYVGYHNSSLGILKLSASDLGLRSIEMVLSDGIENPNQFIHYYKDQLTEYERGNPIKNVQYFDFNGATPFFQQVWQALTTIPYGETLSYKHLAIKIGNPKAIRAVAKANSKNPIPIIIPCHRVIGSDGSLTGFSLGLDVKRMLLIHEKSMPAELF